MAFLSSLVILLLGNLAVFRIPVTVWRNSAFCPWFGIFWHANSVAKMYSSMGILFGVVAKLSPRASAFVSVSVILCCVKLHTHLSLFFVSEVSILQCCVH
ncbi:hypothetical protein NL108_017161 [Boleophthalmus pectinirostris]|nr:hypothetical protein NL108_017161 [Boleophthalmus pectinirostris]